jgi:hypothetical protein
MDETLEHDLFTVKRSSKTDAITFKIKSKSIYTSIENELQQRYTFKQNKSGSGIETQFSYKKKRVSVSLFKNKTVFVQGAGCWSWKEEVFDPICENLKKIDRSIDLNNSLSSDTASNSQESSIRSPILVLSQMINNFRKSRRSTPLRDTRENQSQKSISVTNVTGSLSSGSVSSLTTLDPEETFVKEVYRPNDCDSNLTKHHKSIDTNTRNPQDRYVKSTLDQATNTTNDDTVSENENTILHLKNENKDLQETLKALLTQSKLLKTQNEKLLQLLGDRDSEIKVLRTKLNDQSVQQEKIESALSHSKSDLADANAKHLIYEEDIAKLNNENKKTLKEKSDLITELMKVRGSTDTVELKIEKSTENVENKLTGEIKELKHALFKELADIRSQISKSIEQTKDSRELKATHKDIVPDKLASTAGRANNQRVNKPEESVSTAGRAHSNKETTPAKSVGMPIPVIDSDAHSKRNTAFIAGDSMTRVLSTARMCNPNIDVKIKSHSGGRVRDVENTLIRLSKTDHDYIENLDAIVLHVGTNNVSDAVNCEQIVVDFKDTFNTIHSLNPRAKIVVSSIIPRRNDRLLNEKINLTNKALKNICDDLGHHFLNNNNNFMSRSRPLDHLYRDHIHVNARGGKLLGTDISTSLKAVLGLPSSDFSSSIDNKHFYNGRFQGRGGYYQHNTRMVTLPRPPYWTGGLDQWPYQTMWY